MSELVQYSEQTFESIKHINEYGEEYWLARELQPVLEYVSRMQSNAQNWRVKIADLQSKTILPLSAKWLISDLVQSVKLTMSCFPDTPAT